MFAIVCACVITVDAVCDVNRARFNGRRVFGGVERELSKDEVEAFVWAHCGHI